MFSTVDLIWYSATTVWTFLMVPQLLKSFKSKSMWDISRWMVFMYVINCSLWLTYGYLISAMPVILCNFIALIIGLFQLSLKIKYK